MTPEHLHRIKSFAYANVKLANPNITMDMIDRQFIAAVLKASIFLHQYLSGSRTVSKPVPGDWYDLNGSRIWFIGYDACGVAFAQGKNTLPFIMPDGDITKLTHLPDCTGWDWEPETFPQWIVHKTGSFVDGAYIKRLSATEAVECKKDGSTKCRKWLAEETDLLKSGDWKQITEAEALALLDQKPAEVYPLEIEEDLPKPRRTITVPKWLVIYSDGDIEIFNRTWTPVGQEVHRVGETTYEIEE